MRTINYLINVYYNILRLILLVSFIVFWVRY